MVSAWWTKIFYALTACLLGLASPITIAAEQIKTPTAYTQVKVPAADEGARPDSVTFSSLAPARMAPALPNIRDRTAFTAWLDGTIRTYLEQHNIAGATLAIVLDGQPYVVRGYGVVDTDGTPADAAQHLFRAGSISKTFIWTAMMQLQAQGKLDLNDLVNDHLQQHLKFDTADDYPPIRLKHLMTHTAGFEDSFLNSLFKSDASALQSTEFFLKNLRPERVRAPGEQAVYSNYGATLAAYIVARIAGIENFENYAERHIFAPLSMNHATFREPHSSLKAGVAAPASAEHSAAMAKPLIFEQGNWRETFFDYIGPQAPSGALSVTATDMASYMLMHLGRGTYNDATVLPVVSADQMRRISFSNHPDVAGIAHGFMTYPFANGMTGYGHRGATLHFASNMVIVQEPGLGIFISTNNARGHALVEELPGLLVARYFTDPQQAAHPAPDSAPVGKRFEGHYLDNRRSFSNIEALAGLASMTRVTIDGAHLVTHRSGTTDRWVQTGPLTFQHITNGRKIAFREDNDGTVYRLYFANGLTTADKVPFFRTANWLILLFALTVLTATATLIVAWRKKRMRFYENKRARLSARIYSTTAAFWLLATLAALIAAYGIMVAGIQTIFDFPNVPTFIALSAILIAVIMTLVSVANLYNVWTAGYWDWRRRLRYSISVLVWTIFSASLWGWHVVGYNYY